MHASNICKTCKVEVKCGSTDTESRHRPHLGRACSGKWAMQYCICPESEKAVFGEFQKPYWDGHNFCLLLFQATNQPPPRTEPHLSCSLAFLLLSQNYCVGLSGFG